MKEGEGPPFVRADVKLGLRGTKVSATLSPKVLRLPKE